MNLSLISIPVVAALCGGIIVSVLQRKLLKKTLILLPGLAASFARPLLADNNVRDRLSDPANLRQVLPEIEGHIDEFFRYKLGKAMPMIGMFIGDKTIGQLKAVFMKELEDIFPQVMSRYADSLAGSLDVGDLVRRKLASLPPATLQQQAQTMLGAGWTHAPLLGVAAGLLTGFLQLLVLTLIN